MQATSVLLLCNYCDLKVRDNAEDEDGGEKVSNAPVFKGQGASSKEEAKINVPH